MINSAQHKPLKSDRPLIVYLDFKSPYAYLAKDPIADMAREIGIQVDWRPFVLDIPSYLGAAKLDRSGQVAEQKRTPQQWSGVKYAYFDCRRYANLRGITVRGTVKIWNTDLAAIGMLWAKQQGGEILERYIDAVYEPFWKRALDVEDMGIICRVLEKSGADVSGFDDYAQNEGAAENEALQSAAFAAGIFGVPTCVVNEHIYFGREHLPRIRWHLTGAHGPAPDVAYEAPNEAPDEVPEQAAVKSAKVLEICVDFKDPYSYLALAPTLKLADKLGISILWHTKMTSPFKPLSAYDNKSMDRSTRHRYLRAQARVSDIDLYAPHRLPKLSADFDVRPAATGLLWIKRHAPDKQSDYVSRVFNHYWRDQTPQNQIAQMPFIKSIIQALGVEHGGFADYVQKEGAVLFEAEEQRLHERGVISTPAYLLDNELFLGRQHLPLIKARLLYLER